MSEDDAAELKALRMVMERLLVLVPTVQLEAWAESEERHLEHLQGGGETIPPTTSGDRRASEIALEYYRWGVEQRASFRLDERG